MESGLTSETRLFEFSGGVPRCQPRTTTSGRSAVISSSFQPRPASSLVDIFFPNPEQNVPEVNDDYPRALADYVANTNLFVMSPDKFKMKCKSPDTTVDSSISAELSIPFLKVTIYQQLYHIIPAISDLLSRYRRYQRES